jgi:hypothetical protein
MSDIKKLTIELDFKRLFKLYVDILKMVTSKYKRPNEFYFVCRLFIIDLERDFDVISSENMEKFLDDYKKHDIFKKLLWKDL